MCWSTMWWPRRRKRKPWTPKSFATSRKCRAWVRSPSSRTRQVGFWDSGKRRRSNQKESGVSAKGPLDLSLFDPEPCVWGGEYQAEFFPSGHSHGESERAELRDRHLDITEWRRHVLVPVHRIRRHDEHIALADAMRRAALH